MRVKRQRMSAFFGMSVAIAVSVSVSSLFDKSHKDRGHPPSVSAIGDPDLLRHRYESWRRQHETEEDGGLYRLSLLPPATTHSIHRDPVRGMVEFDFTKQAIEAQISGLSAARPLELWVTNGARLLSTDTASASVRQVGTFIREGDRLVLRANIDELVREGFEIDNVVVTPTGENPLQSIVLAGSPNLFQRLYAAELYAGARDRNHINLIRAANAAEATGFPDVFNDLVTQGEDLFFNETFDGNGRSCGTCHPATNNFTIDPDYIATLPANDPLFVAENVPALIFGNPENLDGEGNPRRFENPTLMRAFGLIVENVDGMGDLTNRFTMRSVPHNIGMSVSISTPSQDLEELTPPDDRTGWSGDGAPSGVVGGIAASGRLRDFILGAIVQHYPRTLARSFDGLAPDFRAPTPTELDALEAFLLSVGRQQDLELRDGFPNQLVLKDSSAEAGKVLFRDGIPGVSSPRCQGCHGNAGANVLPNDPTNPTNNFGNRNFNTGVELFLQNRMNEPQVTVLGQPRPMDGGFGRDPAGGFTILEEQAGFVNENFGNRTFNTASLVEAADTPPFFHNNIIDNLEDAIRFYNSPEFVDPDGDGVPNRSSGIPFNDTQVRQVANFLRVINALDNIENSALRRADRALLALNLNPNPDDVITRALQIAIADTQDAMEVLNQGNLHNSGGLPSNAVKQLDQGVKGFQQAMNVSAADGARMNHIEKAKEHLRNAVNLMRF